eukprot:NODE_5419_length_510_cov_136.685466_g4037_i0.p2 GENE.NODE_5419_length_510_cov_136.685466_g4037_i0~~NODE_5419_length_510_cov_136.685466_g4037_i0.p2  ORF type:complete len:53 (-),score=10.04 NODE_5419_length_510_cov_136.685466_g4037_i0:148-306(-)
MWANRFVVGVCVDNNAAASKESLRDKTSCCGSQPHTHTQPKPKKKRQPRNLE